MNWDKILNRFGFTWSIRHFFYRLDWSTASSKDVKGFLQDNVELGYVMQKVGQLPKFKNKVKDKLVLEIFQWVVTNIKYITDIKKFGITEKWEDIDDILDNWYLVGSDGSVTQTNPKYNKLATRIADCESMALLLFVLCRINGINPLQIRLVAGMVKEGGHAWLEYAPDGLYDYETQKMGWIILDPAYDPRNNLPCTLRPTIENDDRYLTRWFMVTDI